MLKTLFLLVLALLPLGPATSAAQETRPALDHYNLGKRSLAMEGYDPVSYFQEGGGKPKKGKDTITLTHNGVVYRFLRKEHRELFKAVPGRYEPAYGGWCAWAMSKKKPEKVDIDPKSYLIEEGRLLLFFDGFFADTRKKWLNAGGVKQRPRANAYWNRVSGEKPGRDLLQWNLNQGLALDGHDPTRYRNGEALRGKLEVAAVHGGVTYRFATQDARRSFLASPAEFEPRYGSWCAKAMAMGKRVQADPTAFSVEGNALYVFANGKARDQWKAATNTLRTAADKSWAGIVTKRF